jgi:arsenate reductase
LPDVLPYSPTNGRNLMNEEFGHISLEHQVVLRSSSARLQKEFAGVLSAETIELFLLQSYEDFGSKITVDAYLPTFAERFARQRLKALTIIEGGHDVPVVLFLCVHNAGRSQMAMGFFKAMAGDRAIAWSGGSEPGSQVNPAAIEAMAEVGIDISEEFPKPWTDEIVRAADVVITMGCGDACPIFPGKRYEDWVLEDPAGLGVDDVRPIRSEIEARVRALLIELGVLDPAA